VIQSADDIRVQRLSHLHTARATVNQNDQTAIRAAAGIQQQLPEQSRRDGSCRASPACRSADHRTCCTQQRQASTRSNHALQLMAAAKHNAGSIAVTDTFTNLISDPSKMPESHRISSPSRGST